MCGIWLAYDEYAALWLSPLTGEKMYLDNADRFLEEAHRYGMQVHAWLNPYRVSRDYYYDPGEEESIDRILLAVAELLDYESSGEKVDGIHIDDYFYHALKGYYKPDHADEPYAIVDSEENKPEDAAVTMFMDRLDMFLEKRYNNVGFYVGLALYRTDTDNANAVPKKNWEIL